MKYVWPLILLCCLSGCNVAVLDEINPASVHDFCPGKREADGSCPTKNGTSKKVISFSNSSLFEYDSQVEFLGDKASLKEVKSTQSMDDFNSGNHTGTFYDEQKQSLSLLTKDSPILDLKKILPTKLNNLEGYWKFENNAEDSSGKNLVSQKYGTPYYSLNSKLGSYSNSSGSGADGVLVQDVPYSDKFSVSTWIFLEENSSYRRVFVKGLDSLNTDFSVRENNLKQFRFQMSGVCYSTYFTIPLKTWTHYTFTYGDGYVRVYQNSELISQVTCNDVIGNKGSLLNIGADLNGWSEFLGVLDEFSLWSIVLSAEDVKKIYTTQSLNTRDLKDSWTPKSDDLISYLKMDRNLQDSTSFSNNGSASGNLSYGENSSNDSYLVFDGVDAQVNIPTINTQFNPDKGTISCWVKSDIPAGDTKDRYIFRFFSNASNEISLRLLSNQSVYYVYKGAGVSAASSASNWRNFFKQGQWSHIVTTWDITDSSNISMYINGKLVSSQTQSNLLNNSSFQFFKYGYGVNGYKGGLNDCAIWRSNLSSSDIFEIYTRQSEEVFGQYTSAILDYGQDHNWDKLIVETPLPYAKPLALNSEANFYEGINTDLSSGLVAYWGFEESSLNSTVDGKDFYESVNSNNLSEEGVPLLAQKGVTGHSLYLDGVDDNLVAADNNSLDVSSSLTLSVWFRSSGDLGDSNVYGGFINKGNYSGSVTYGLRVFNSSYEFLVRQTDGVYKRSRRNMKPKIVDGKWHHLVGIADATSGEVKVYLDGVLQTNTIDTTFNGTIVKSGHNLSVGKDYAAKLFHGNVDEAAIWNRALSSDEVSGLYQRGLNKVSYQVRSCSTSQCSNAQWIGPEGLSSPSLYNEFHNNDSIDAFGIPTGVARADNPNFTYDNFVMAPATNRYFQYRVLFNLSSEPTCALDECIAGVKKVVVDSNTSYYADYAQVVPKEPLSINRMKRIDIDSPDSCELKFQISDDGINYRYWDGEKWEVSTGLTDSNSKTILTDKLRSFNNSQPYSLYIKTILKSDATQSCSIKSITVTDYNID